MPVCSLQRTARAPERHRTNAELISHRPLYSDDRTVAGGLAVLGREVEAFAEAPARVRHDAQPALQDGHDHRDVRAVPQQLPVLHRAVPREVCRLQHTQQLCVSIQRTCALVQVCTACE